MKDARGEGRNPGEFRDRQNWMVKTSALKNAVVCTQPPPEAVPDLLGDPEMFCNADDGVSPLIRRALAHCQFEATHPFGDGNGRMGRLLALLVPHKTGLLREPLPCLNAFFDRHRAGYYGGLLEVSRRSRRGAWIKFSLKAFAVQSAGAIDNIGKLDGLRGGYRKILRDWNAGGKAVDLTESLFANPYVNIPLAGKRPGASHRTARRTVRALVDAGIPAPTDTPHRRKILAATEIDASMGMGWRAGRMPRRGTDAAATPRMSARAARALPCARRYRRTPPGTRRRSPPRRTTSYRLVDANRTIQ